MVFDLTLFDIAAYSADTNCVTAQRGVRQDNATTIENRNIQLALKLPIRRMECRRPARRTAYHRPAEPRR